MTNILNEDLFTLYNIKTNTIHRVQTWAGGRPSTDMKTWKTLSGASKALQAINEKQIKLGKEPIIEIRKLGIKGINDE